MKKILAFFVLICSTHLIQAQDAGPRPSPAGSVSTEVGKTSIKVEYFRPQMKGRKIFGKGDNFLVPFGKAWRTGANSGTKISFSEDVTVEGIKVSKGEYLILTWPGQKEWTISLYTDTSIGGRLNNYEESKDAAKFTVTPQRLTEKVETLTFNITDLAEDSTQAYVQMAWENTSVKFKVVVNKTW